MGHGRAIDGYLRAINQAYGRGDAASRYGAGCREAARRLRFHVLGNRRRIV